MKKNKLLKILKLLSLGFLVMILFGFKKNNSTKHNSILSNIVVSDAQADVPIDSCGCTAAAGEGAGAGAGESAGGESCGESCG